jgi:PKD repeat protein
MPRSSRPRTRPAAALLTAAAVVAALLVALTALPAQPADRQVRLVAAGDFGASTNARSVLQGMAAVQPDAALALGDLAYRDLVPETAWCTFVKSVVGQTFPFQLLSGNHESLDVADGAINNYSSCLPNQIAGISGTYGREYVMDFPRSNPLVRVIMASPALTFEDGRWNYLAGDAHHRWLAAAIAAGRAAGAKWTIVAAHIPCYSMGTYSCPGSTDFFRLMAEQEVDLVLHGHEHAYLRTHQLGAGNGSCTATIPAGTANPDCVVDADSSFAAGAGTVFATVGSGGVPLRNLSAADAEAPYFAAWSGANVSPAFGFLDLDVQEEVLRASFTTTAGGPFADSFTITRGAAPPPSNQPPAASFTATAQGLAATFDASASTDSDGSIAGYRWDFGDGSPAVTTTGPTTSRTYPGGGTWTVALTVTDNQGATAIATRQVVTTAPVGRAVARDSFTRTVAGGWGTADLGGPWTVSGAASAYSVDGATGGILMGAGHTRRTTLGSVSAAGSELVFTTGYTGTVTGGGLHIVAAPRILPDGTAYRAKVVVDNLGVGRLRLVRATAAGAETGLSSWSGVITGFTSAKRLVLRTEVSGSGPTTIRAKAWFAGDAEPAAWQATATDSTSTMQGPGALGLVLYQSSSATAPLTVRIDDLEAVPR